MQLHRKAASFIQKQDRKWCWAASPEARALHEHLQSDHLPSCHLHQDSTRLPTLNTQSRAELEIPASNLLLSHLPNLSTWETPCLPCLGQNPHPSFPHIPHPIHQQILLALLLKTVTFDSLLGALAASTLALHRLQHSARQPQQSLLSLFKMWVGSH